MHGYESNDPYIPLPNVWNTYILATVYQKGKLLKCSFTEACKIFGAAYNNIPGRGGTHL